MSFLTKRGTWSAHEILGVPVTDDEIAAAETRAQQAIGRASRLRREREDSKAELARNVEAGNIHIIE